jgi:phosphate transport system substrate-binding protein
MFRPSNIAVSIYGGRMKKMILVVLMLAATCLWAQRAKAETLVIQGTGACETVLKSLAAAFNHQNQRREVRIPPSIGSGGGIGSVIDDKCVVARVARPLKGTEAEQRLTYLVFAKDSIIFGVGAKVDIKNLSTTQLIDIFSGKKENWQEVGGNKAIIRVLIREATDSSFAVIKKHIHPFQTIRFTNRSKLLYHDYEMVEALMKYKRAIGWLTSSTASAYRDSIRPVAIDGISPDSQNVLAGKYRLVGDYALVYKQHRLTALAKEFVDYIFSEQGRQVMKKHGLTPVNRR